VRFREREFDLTAEAYREALTVWEKIRDANNNDPGARRNLAKTHLQLGDVAFQKKDYAAAADECRKSVAIYEELVGQGKKEAYRQELADAYGNLSWYEVLNNQGQAAITAALAAVKLQPDMDWVAVNLVTGYLLVGSYEQAVSTFEEFKDKKLGGGKSFGDVLRGDLTILQGAGITTPDLERFQRLLEQ